MSIRNFLGGSFLADKARRASFTSLHAGTGRRNLRLEHLEARRLMVVNAAAAFPAEIAPGTGYDGVVSLSGCTGTMLSTGRHILTAAHCVDIDDLPNRRGDGIVNAGPWPVTFVGLLAAPLWVPSDDITLHWLPGATDGWDGVHSHGSDIAIMELPELAPIAAKGWDIYTDFQEVGREFSFVGFGGTNFTTSSKEAMSGGVGADDCDESTPVPPGADHAAGQVNCGKKRFGKNQLDSITTFAGSGGKEFDENLRFDLDDPSGPTPGIANEAVCAPGDSGGPLFIDNLIAGVTSGCDPKLGGHGNYTRVTRFADWINQTVDNDYDLVIDMAHQRSIGGGDGAADTISLSSSGNTLYIKVNGTNVFQEEHLDRVKSIKIKGSNDSEAVRIESGSSVLALGVPITFDGRGGINTLTIDDSPIADAFAPHTVRLFSDRIERWIGPLGIIYNNVHFSNLNELTYRGAQNTDAYDIYASPWLSGGQTTIYTSPILNDEITVRPRDLAGNPTIFGRIGIFAGASPDDKLYIDDSLVGISGTIWNVENPHGAATQSFSVAGGDTIGAYLDVEKVILKGSTRDDVFRIESYRNGSSLEVQGMDGADTLTMSPTRHNLSADITKMSYFGFDGGTGDNRFQLYNDSNQNTWSYTRNSTQLLAREIGTGYGGMELNHTAIGTLRVLAGPQLDQFLVEETPVQAGYITELDGGFGPDNYAVRAAAGAQNLRNIRGAVRFVSDGGDALLIDDRSNPEGRTYHVTATQIGHEGGDNMFGPFGFVEFLGAFQFVQVATGHGVDLAHVVPHATTPLEIVGGDPTTVPGDALFLNVAEAVNPQLNELNSSTGVYTFDNRASVTYVGVEQRQSVVIKPDHDLDGVPDLVEDGAAGGDGNNDGIPDSQQADVASLPSLTGAYVTLVAQAGLTLADVHVVAVPVNAPAGVQFPLGFFDFRVLDLNPGEATNVTLILPQGMAATSYWKYGKTPDNTTDHWYEFTHDGGTGASISQGGKVVTLHFVDGQRGDDALRVDGRIVDPGSPGISTVCQVLGDTNSDCAVNVVDLNNVRNHFGETGDAVLGDTNGDRKVDVADLNNVRNYFGTTSGAPASTSVPSPIASFALAPRAVDAILAEQLLSHEMLHNNLPSPRSRRVSRRAMHASSLAAMPDEFEFPKVAQARLQPALDTSQVMSRPLGS